MLAAPALCLFGIHRVVKWNVFASCWGTSPQGFGRVRRRCHLFCIQVHSNSLKLCPPSSEIRVRVDWTSNWGATTENEKTVNRWRWLRYTFPDERFVLSSPTQKQNCCSVCALSAETSFIAIGQQLAELKRSFGGNLLAFCGKINNLVTYFDEQIRTLVVCALTPPSDSADVPPGSRQMELNLFGGVGCTVLSKIGISQIGFERNKEK